MLKNDGKGHIKTIAVASGKGGVGKTNVVINLAVAASKLGKKVIILDADLGLSNVDVLLQLAPRYNIQHVLSGEKSLAEIMADGPHGIKVLPASSGVQELTSLDEFQRLKIMEEFDAYTGDFDLLIIDTAAGISENVAFFCVAAQETVIVTSPEPTALTDAYALIKVLFTRYQEREFSVMVNSVKSPEEAFEVFKRLMMVTGKFLNVSLNYLGYIPFDGSIRKAVRAQRPFIDMFPSSDASRQVNGMAEKIMESTGKVKGSLQFFLGNMISGTGPARCK
ncbi:MAG: MinD/ParA family protein [Nitrospiraceae bacterium]|nr:MinD/ParA family protein [Nitrospiraceae bacterium]MDA8090859.1 MinD/ParA family protein [Nitrospiraceae bacterium]